MYNYKFWMIFFEICKYPRFSTKIVLLSPSVLGIGGKIATYHKLFVNWKVKFFFQNSTTATFCNPAQFCSNLPIHIFWGPNDHDNVQLLSYIQGSLHKINFNLPESCRRTYKNGLHSINCQSHCKMVSNQRKSRLWNEVTACFKPF